MSILLSKAGSGLTVKQLLDTLQEVLDFEALISKKYVTSVGVPVRSIMCLFQLRIDARASESHPTSWSDSA